MDEKWYLEKIGGLEDSIGRLIKNVEILCDRIISLEGEMIDLKRFYLAFRISQCKKCNSKVIDWESPIILKALDTNKNFICKEHQKEMDEFNRRHASD